MGGPAGDLVPHPPVGKAFHTSLQRSTGRTWFGICAGHGGGERRGTQGGHFHLLCRHPLLVKSKALRYKSRWQSGEGTLEFGHPACKDRAFQSCRTPAKHGTCEVSQAGHLNNGNPQSCRSGSLLQLQRMTPGYVLPRKSSRRAGLLTWARDPALLSSWICLKNCQN